MCHDNYDMSHTHTFNNSLAWLDPSLPARECNCDGRVRKSGHFIFQLRNLTNQILLVGMQLVGSAEVYW